MFRSRRLILLACACSACALVPPVASGATGGAPSLGARQVLSLGSGVTDPRALATADLDGDGRADLVAGSANGGTGAVSVLRGTSGGAFAAPLGSPYGLGGASGGVGALAAGDLNGDGRPDVLAAIGSGTADNDELVPLAGDGSGALSAGGAVAVPGEQLAGVALGDLDGDGDLDALTASATAVEAEQLGVVEQTPSGLAPAGAVGAAGTLLARAVAIGDLDGDGHPDALVASGKAGTGSAWVATGAGLTLTPATPVAVSADPVAATLADVDGDGDLDALVLDGTTNVLSALRNDGAGALTATSVLVDGLATGTGVAAATSTATARSTRSSPTAPPAWPASCPATARAASAPRRGPRPGPARAPRSSRTSPATACPTSPPPMRAPTPSASCATPARRRRAARRARPSRPPRSAPPVRPRRSRSPTRPAPHR